MDVELKFLKAFLAMLFSGTLSGRAASRCGFVLCSQAAFPDAYRTRWGGKTPKLLIRRDKRKMWSWWAIASLVSWLAVGASGPFLPEMLTPLP